MPVTEVAERFGMSRQAVQRWIGWYRDEGLDGLADRSHRPHAHPAWRDMARCTLGLKFVGWTR